MKAKLRVLATGIVIVGMTAIVSAQPNFGRGGGDRGGRGDRGGFGGGDFRERMLSRIDQNGNGIIDPDESSGRMGGFVQQMARSAGLDPGRPISINKLLGRPDTKSPSSRRSANSEEESAYPIVPVFGEESALVFGVSPNTLAGKLIDIEKKYDRGVLESVRRTLDRYDTNKNNLLDHNEWQSVSWRGSDPLTADVDKDALLTKAELAEMFAKRDQERSSSRGGDPRSRFGRGGGDNSGRDNSGRGGFGRGGFGGFSPGGGDQGGRGGFGRGGGDQSGRGGRGGGGGDEGGFGRGGRGGRGESDQGGGRGGFGRGGGDEGGGRGGFGRGGDQGGSRGGRGGGDQGGGGGRRGFDPTELIKRMDQNGDGTIDPSEVDERRAGFLAARFQLDFSKPLKISEISKKVGGNSANPEPPVDQAYKVEGTAKSSGRKSYRKINERSSLPRSWREKDKNGDGQVELSEYMAEPSETAVEEFEKFDLNRDGVITAKESEVAAKNE